METTALLLTLTTVVVALVGALALLRRSVAGRHVEQIFRVRGELEPVTPLDARRRPDIVLRRVA